MELRAQNINVCRKGKLILNQVSFCAQPGTLTAIIGPNGAGKTTLMRALSGERPDGGQVLINGEELYDAPEYWLQQIGYVPVDNILHEHLTVQDALMYVGRMRLPSLSVEQVEKRVDELLTTFGFAPGDERRSKPIRVLSSGERKRANVCSELIIDPPILMLDEPTSNLDPDAEYHLMDRLAHYSHESGKTILVITHTLNTIDVCDQVLFIENSRLRASGRPQEVLETLEQELERTTISASPFYRWARVFERYQTRPDRASCLRGNVIRRQARQHPARRSAPAPWFYQLRCLLARYMKVRLGDRWGLVGTLFAGFSGILFFTLPGNTFVRPYDASEIGLALNQARQSVYVVALVVTLLGLITSYTEISKEYRIYNHERLKGLSPSAYYLSKWVWLTVAVGALAPLLLLLFIVLVYGQPLPDFPVPRIGETVGWWEHLMRFQVVGLLTRPASWLILLTLVLACITSVTMGLLISAVAGSSGKGYLYLSFAVVFIVLFSGLIRNERLERLVDTLSVASTGKWAYEGVASSLGIYCWLDSWRFDEFNSTGHIMSIWLALGAFILLAGFLAVLVLRLRDPWYGQWTNLRRFAVREGRPLTVYLSIVVLLLSYTLFLRQQSYEYHTLNYWSRQEYGGTNAYEYASVQKVQELDQLQHWNGTISQSWCGVQ
jgi:ABC-type multidrug transport system ATPase subunit/uncharacterized membrane protein YhaH (DUF805 family)